MASAVASQTDEEGSQTLNKITDTWAITSSVYLLATTETFTIVKSLMNNQNDERIATQPSSTGVTKAGITLMICYANFRLF